MSIMYSRGKEVEGFNEVDGLSLVKKSQWSF